MSIISHLQEFRKRIVLSAGGIVLGSVGGWFTYGTLIKTLSKPAYFLRAPLDMVQQLSVVDRNAG